ncbi:acyltransferase domain-containing protein, partial [Nocardiopsis lucentensis]|uniref:acyltransferase domain-containing protein n=1 Tax=Nocardiopsis lucentensis TaxID=53441 RepID=UPI00126948D0
PAAVSGQRIGPVFVFPGQGGQWARMGRGLLAASPVFAAAVDECERALAPFVDWSLREVLRAEPGAPPMAGGGARVDVVQPVLWAVMVSLARLWTEAGVEPSAVVGHSQGEIAAACVAGALSLEDGARVVALRSRLLRDLAGPGAMAVVGLEADRTAEFAAPWAGRIGVAAVNGPESTVVSGDADAVGELLSAADRDGVHARRVDVDYASHSAHVERIRDELRTGLSGIRPREGDIPLRTTVAPATEWSSGSLPERSPMVGTTLGPDHWYRNLRHPVLLAPVVAALGERGAAFVEVSPHPVLTAAIERTLEETGLDDRAVIGTLKRGEDGPTRMWTALAEAHCRGVAVDWARALGTTGRRAHVDLPTYPF